MIPAAWALGGLGLALVIWPWRRAGRWGGRAPWPVRHPWPRSRYRRARLGDSTTRAVALGDVTPYDVADAIVLIAIALRSGRGLTESLESVSAILPGPTATQVARVAAAYRWGLAPEEAWAQVPQVWRPAALAWQICELAGTSPSALLLQAADRIRSTEDRRIEAATARAGVLLVIPLGVAFLPAFIATTVIPVLLIVLGEVASG